MFPNKNNTQISAQKIMLLITGIVLGFLIITQARYFHTYVNTAARDSSENVFQKIKLLKTTNDELEDEIGTLEKQLSETSDRALALESIDKEIQKNMLIAGHMDIAGPGITFEISTPVSDIWLTDIVNELIVSGAEAISVNNIRLTESSIGFDTLPNDQIMLNSVILSPPYTISAIGESETLYTALNTPLGIIDRLKAGFKDFTYSLVKKDRIEMGKI